MFKLSHILLSAKRARRHPVEIAIVAFFYTSLSIFLSNWIFPDQASIVMVFLAVISCLYLIEGILIIEERKEKNLNSEKKILRGHAHTLKVLMSLFLGFLLAFTFWTIVLPESSVEHLFSLQKEAFSKVRAVSGNAVSTDSQTFSLILENNLRVLLLSSLMALFYGAGAVFILSWNASLMGFVIGSLTKDVLGIVSLPYAFLKFFVHGIPEILAYFIGALAGGILFISIIKGDLRKERLNRTILDFFILIVSSIVILVIAALIETFISPLI